MILGPTLLIYLLIGTGVAVAVYLSNVGTSSNERWFAILTALPFWPFYVPLLLRTKAMANEHRHSTMIAKPTDEMSAAITQVDAELQAALDSLDGWAEGVLARERNRIHELRSAWTAQSQRIREMDRLLARRQYSDDLTGSSMPVPIEPGPANERLRHSQEVRRQNIERLWHVRQRAYEDLMGTLAWVRELVSMIHLAKFTGAPASRAEELVAQIAAAVEGLSEVACQQDNFSTVGE